MLLFLLLEGICIALIVKYNDYQKSAFLSSSNSVCGAVFSVQNSISQYFGLRHENDILAKENAELRSIIAQNDKMLRKLNDSTYNALKAADKPKYIYRSAQVINSSTNKSRNYLTINAGASDGIAADMTARNAHGVVGIVSAVSDHYATILPIINTSFRLSVKLLSNNFRGQLEWDGVSPRTALMVDVPEHAKVAVGDSIVTSGSSSYFPEGLPVGTVKNIDYDKNGGFYRLDIDLAVDFSSIYNIEVIENTELAEQQELETLNTNADE
ncbi:MAG: rod shape-determining protein MreC [Bacteroidales bacterium]|nr:rod shape-determining protein MreC [Bacteroidales bacterium]